MNYTRHSQLFRLGCHLMKYFLMGLYGFLVASILAAFMGASGSMVSLLVTALPWLAKAAAIILGVMGVAVMLESVR